MISPIEYICKTYFSLCLSEIIDLFIRNPYKDDYCYLLCKQESIHTFFQTVTNRGIYDATLVGAKNPLFHIMLCIICIYHYQLLVARTASASLSLRPDFASLPFCYVPIVETSGEHSREIHHLIPFRGVFCLSVPRRVPFLYSNETVFVTGGSSDTGWTVARRFADAGAMVIVADIRSEP